MQIHYRFIPEHHLLIEKFSGDFNFDFYYPYIHQLVVMPEWAAIKRILIDIRDIDLSKAFRDLDKMIALRKMLVQKDYMGVFLVDKPMQTALVELYQQQLTKHYHYRYYSTLDKALDILELSTFGKQIEHKLKHELILFNHQ